ncbi:hypothetical protein KPL47_14365 [Clostridium estertheticum]|uniref:Uncharacterized protein n=1 Tax=Clostridium estertheticum TaxID=238834 RepID=A0AA47EID4_9CLOT|nr:hypothetical protein [Clostridium estertheticum]MBU3153373.1 hypothetical protein [Clostridium estertheticum]MBU3177519.1 hypothetical protein [Clostridium estertheticum]WAG60778.1 hypothetical protein LL038_00570 [Clostridium estertheticum]
MGKIIEWKKEEEVNTKGTENIEEINETYESEEDSLLVIHQFVKAYYEDEKQEEIHPYELNGFEVGLISYLNLLEKGLLPNIIKNINVLAVNKFDRLSKLFPEVDIPQEFYIGFLKGFCSVYDKYM